MQEKNLSNLFLFIDKINVSLIDYQIKKEHNFYAPHELLNS